MAILGFHFSGVYKNDLYSNAKTATVMMGEFHFPVGEKVQVYLSDKPNLFDGYDERRIGEAAILRLDHLRVEDLTIIQANKCGYQTVDDLAQALVGWYNSTPDSVITYVEFDLALFPES